MDDLQIRVRGIVSTFVSDIYFGMDDNRFRCHEIARLLAAKLVKEGFPDIQVKDGLVRYKTVFLYECMLKDLGKPEDDLIEAVVEETKAAKQKTNPNEFTAPIRHSWLELGDLVIDHQNVLEISAAESLHNFFLVERKFLLKGEVSYTPKGKNFSVFNNTILYIPPFYFTKIRIDNQ